MVILLVLLMAVTLAFPAVASAQSASCPSPPGLSFSDELCIVTGQTFQGFLTESGEPSPGSITAGGPPTAPFPIPIPLVLFNSLFPSPSNQVYSIYLTAPGSGHISDLLQMSGGSIQGQQFFLSFIFFSDADTPSGLPGTLPPACLRPLTPISLSCSMAETGDLQDVSSFFGLQFTVDNTTVNIPVWIASDVERVPAPAGLILLGSALAGIAAWRRYSRR